jgi:hypothetical protein
LVAQSATSSFQAVVPKVECRFESETALGFYAYFFSRLTMATLLMGFASK